MRKIILFLALLMVSSAFADEKPGRFFKDQPDVTNDPQVHFIYLLNKNSKDNTTMSHNIKAFFLFCDCLSAILFFISLALAQ